MITIPTVTGSPSRHDPPIPSGCPEYSVRVSREAVKCMTQDEFRAYSDKYHPPMTLADKIEVSALAVGAIILCMLFVARITPVFRSY